MEALRRELIYRIETMPAEELAVLHAFLASRASPRSSFSAYAFIAEKIASFLRKYAIGHTLDGYEYLRTVMHIILENPSAYPDTFEAVY